MVIRPIRRDELEQFAAFTDSPARNAGLARYLNNLLNGDQTRPDWLIVAEQDGAFIGRIAYSGDRGEAIPAYTVFFDAPWDTNSYMMQRELLQRSLSLVGAERREEIEYYLDTPSDRVPSPDQLVAALQRLGFSLTLERLAFEWLASSPVPTRPDRLVFKTLAEAGDEVFIAAMARVSEGSFDGYTQRRSREIGALAEAREHFRDEQRYQMRWEPHWWRLAYTPADELVGLVMPSENTSWPNIGYIGVVPEQRGRGYVDDLLVRGTETLRAEGATRIIAHTDLANVPMANAFRRCGYAQFATRRIFTLRL